MKSHVPIALFLAISLPAGALAQEEECADAFAALQKQIDGSALQAAYKGREASHPMVLRMADGSLVDLTGVIIVSTPYESWTGGRPVVDKVSGYIADAQPLIEAGDEDECLKLLKLARTEIAAASGSGEGDAGPASASPSDQEMDAAGEAPEDETDKPTEFN